jgi:hypothetical protein
MPNYQNHSRRLLWLLAAIPLFLSGCYATVRARPDEGYVGRGYYDRPYGYYYAPPPPRGVVVVSGGHHGHWEHHRDYYRAPRVVEHRHDRRHWR